MKTKEFTFKKTVKTVKQFNGLSIDLLPQEAADLASILGSIGGDDGYGGAIRETRDKTLSPLYAALQAFAVKHSARANVRLPISVMLRTTEGVPF